jgi:hypothetical protein
VRKLFIFFLGISLTSIVFVFPPNLAFASTQALSIPPTAEGPGLLLPNSPLYFIDQLKQEFRLLLAFTPEQKAKIHNRIVGERLAELRLMLAKNDASGIRVSLQGISDSFKAASEDLANAKLTGRDVTSLAKEINDSIKDKQGTLSVLESQATGELKAQVVAAKEGLKDAKVQVEENLPADTIAGETIDDLNLQITDSINSAGLSVAEINRAIELLTKIASTGAAKSQTDLKSLVDEFQKALNRLSKEAATTTTAASNAAAKSTKNSLDSSVN